MSDTQTRTILIVDDDTSTVQLLERQLAQAGYSTLKANNGAEAMRILLAEGISLVITDWIMPEMDGLDLCRAIRSHEGIRFAHIILLTAQNDREIFIDAFDAGADDCISKPVDRRELLARIRAAERNLKLQRELEAKNREVHRSNALAEIANNQLAEANRKLKDLATTDELTGLPNRREAFAHLSELWITSARHQEALACIMIDIDHFKRLNDTYGHAVGDVVLKETSRLLRRAARAGEPVYRIGGEEFLVVCPRSTAAQAVRAAERMRATVQAGVITVQGKPLSVSISLGVADRRPDMKQPDDLVRLADHSLYEAKNSGRNRVFAASSDDLEMPNTSKQEAESGRPGAVSAIAPTSEEFAIKEARVLLVGPDRRSADPLRDAMKQIGCALLEVEPGVVGTGQLLELPDVIFINDSLDESSRRQWLDSLKADPVTREVPIVLALDRQTLSTCQQFDSRIDEYVVKPISLVVLSRRIETMVRLRRSLQRSNAVRGEQSRALALVSEFCWRLAAAESLAVVMERSVAAMAELTCCRQVAVLLPDRSGQLLEVARSIGLDGEQADRLRLRRGVGPVGTVFDGSAVSSGCFVLSQSDADSPDHFLLADAPAVVLPLQSPESIVGVMTIAGRQTGEEFAPLELEYVELVGNIAASAINDCLSRKARDEARDSIVVALAKLAEYRDSDTGRHLDRVTQFCLILANELRALNCYGSQISDQFISDLRRAVPLHDIGKVAIPDNILYKPAQLTPDERAIMRTHTRIGAKAIQSVVDRTPGAKFLMMAADIAFAHHEWYNGQGYPRGVAREEIPLAARIAAVADVYDALTTERVYKNALSHEKAVSLIQSSSGAQFDPNVVEAFQNCSTAFQQLANNLADEPHTQSFPDQADHELPEHVLAGFADE